MKWYCEKCKKIHSDDELCPHIQKQLKDNPDLLGETANFVTIAGEYSLISSNALDTVAKSVNKIAGTNLGYEGTHQVARDIQVFKRLSEEPFVRSGHFATPEKAKAYWEAVKEVSKTNSRAMTSFESKLTGYAQEADWLRYKQSQLSSIYEKSSLLSNNTAGIDGTTVNRFTGKTISRTTVKASKNLMTKNSTAITDVKEAIAKGTATEKDIIFSTKGTGAAASEAGLKNPVIEKNTVEQVNASNKRLEEKISAGKATTTVTMEQVGQKMVQGAVIGAAVGLTISSITNYVRYKNGEITKEDAFKEVGEDTLKSAVTGGALAALTLFLPAGPVGVVAGVAVGIYLNAACTNVLDEIFGKGAYGAILNSSGYVYGMAMNLKDCLDQIEKNVHKTNANINRVIETQRQISDNFDLFNQLKGE